MKTTFYHLKICYMKFFIYDPATQQVKSINPGYELQTMMLFNYCFLDTERESYWTNDIVPEFFNL